MNLIICIIEKTGNKANRNAVNSDYLKDKLNRKLCTRITESARLQGNGTNKESAYSHPAQPALVEIFCKISIISA